MTAQSWSAGILLGALAGAAITLAIEAMWPRLPDVNALFPMRHEDAAFFHICVAQTGNEVQCEATVPHHRAPEARKTAAGTLYTKRREEEP